MREGAPGREGSESAMNILGPGEGPTSKADKPKRQFWALEKGRGRGEILGVPSIFMLLNGYWSGGDCPSGMQSDQKGGNGRDRGREGPGDGQSELSSGGFKEGWSRMLVFTECLLCAGYPLCGFTYPFTTTL